MGVYRKDKKEYKSVTTIISEHFPFNQEEFNKWCEKNGYDPKVVNVVSTSMGSKVSGWIDNYRRDMTDLNEPSVGKYEAGLYEGVQKFLNEYVVLDTEETVYCDEFMYAGTYDGLVEYKGEKWLMDWKTYGAWLGKYRRDASKIKKVKIQLSMYEYALGESINKAVVIFKADGSYEIEELKTDNSWKEWFK
jgi:hypothetical protein